MALFIETRWHQFREGSVVSRQSSYRIDRMAIVCCHFIFLAIDWFRLFSDKMTSRQFLALRDNYVYPREMAFRREKYLQ